MNYLNEWNPFAAQWCRNLADAGEIPKCVVDETDIRKVTGDQLREYKQCHFFAGIAGWPLALKLAGVPEDFRIWTGSCPCQPFSRIGKKQKQSDDRHLWPEMSRLIRECRPPFAVGEQVAGRDGEEWLKAVQSGLERDGYGFVSAELCAPCVEEDHNRSRIYWGAWCLDGFRPVRFASDCDEDGDCPECGIDYAECECPGPTEEGVFVAECDDGLFGCRLADSNVPRQFSDRGAVFSDQRNDTRGGSASDRRILVYASGERPQRFTGDVNLGDEPGWLGQDSSRSVAATGVRDLVECENGKFRPFQPGSFPLAHGFPRKLGPGQPELQRLVRSARANRNGRIEGYGNAIVPELGAMFIRAFLGAIQDGA
jgi:DNA (cytosine-5)-methyltransferase 1